MFDWFINIIKLTAAKSYTPNQGPQRVVPRYNYKSLSTEEEVPEFQKGTEKSTEETATTAQGKIQKIIDNIYQSMNTGNSPVPGKSVADIVRDVLNYMHKNNSKLNVKDKYNIMHESEPYGLGLDEQTLDTLILINFVSKYLDTNKISSYLGNYFENPEAAYNNLITSIPKLINANPGSNTSLKNLKTAVHDYINDVAESTESLTPYEDGANDEDGKFGRGIADENEPNQGLPEEQFSADTTDDTKKRDNDLVEKTDTGSAQENQKYISRIKGIYEKVKRKFNRKNPSLVKAFGDLLNTLSENVSDTSDAKSTSNSINLANLPQDVKSIVSGTLPLGMDTGLNVHNTLTKNINNTKVSVPSVSAEPVAIVDLRDMRKAAIDTKNLLSPYFKSGSRRAVTDINDLKRRIKDVEANIEEYKRTGKDEAFVNSYKEASKYEQLKDIVSSLEKSNLGQKETEDTQLSLDAVKTSLEKTIKKYTDSINRGEKNTADTVSKALTKDILRNKSNAIKALRSTNLSDADRRKFTKALNSEYNALLRDVFSEKYRVLFKRMSNSGNTSAYTSESDMNKLLADTLANAAFDSQVSSASLASDSLSYDQYKQAVSTFSRASGKSAQTLPENTEPATEPKDLSEALYVLYKDPSRAQELSTEFPKKYISYFLYLLLNGLSPELKKEIEQEQGKPVPTYFFDEETAARDLNDTGALRSLLTDPDSEEGLSEQYETLLGNKKVLEDSIENRENQLTNLKEKGANKEEISKVETILNKKKELLHTVNERIKDVGARLIALNKDHFTERDLGKKDEIEPSEIKTVFPDKKAYEYSGNWYEVVKNPVSNKYKVTTKKVQDPVIVDPEVYKVDSDLYVSGKNSDKYYKLNQETGSISDIPQRDLLGDYIGTYKEWYNSGSKSRINPKTPENTHIKINERIVEQLRNNPEKSKELLLRVYDKPDTEVSSYIKNSLFENFEDNADALLDFSKRININNAPEELVDRLNTIFKEHSSENKKQKEEPKEQEDLISPTEDEEVITEKSGFMFGMRRTAAFFKFAASDDNYTEMNSKQEDKEQKLIEAPGVEDFQYNEENSENSKTEDVELTEEFSMEKLGKVLRIIKSESPEKWEEIVDIVRQSSAKSGDELAVFLQLFANNNWNGEAALRAYNKEAVSPRNRSYFWSMFKRNVWPQLQSNPSVVNVVKALNKNVAVDEEDVDTNEYKNV